MAALVLGPRLPAFAPFVAAAILVPIALLIDRLRGRLHVWREGNDNPVAQLFMRFIRSSGCSSRW